MAIYDKEREKSVKTKKNYDREPESDIGYPISRNICLDVLLTDE